MKRIVIVVLTIILITLTSTLAFFMWNSAREQDINVALNLSGLDAFIHYNKGTDVLTGTLLPSTDYTGGISTEIELWKDPSAESRTIYGHIYMDITTIGPNLANEPALKWAITSNNKVLNTGDFIGKSNGNSIELSLNIPLSTTKELYQIYIWLDESMNINDAIEGETIATVVRAEASEVMYAQNASQFITSLLYYNPDTMNNDDLDGNVRYMGANPNNYVLFNNELWRIIGVFDVASTYGGPTEKRIKIIRDEPIGNYSWDNKASGTGSSTSSYGSNDWTDSALMEVLNNGAYWNRTSGTCPYGQNGAITSCDFSSNGLTDEAKSLIGDAVWNLGGTVKFLNNVNGLPEHFYKYERGIQVYSTNSTYWVGKVGLIYPSDYGYATSGGGAVGRNLCLKKELTNWADLNYIDCINNNYLYIYLSYWTLTPYSGDSINVFDLRREGRLLYYYTTVKKYVFPALYLKSTVEITGGTGTRDDPYALR